ncbi:MAG: GNAT family N-acetyltransferase, partial [Candidatus Omnitrophica bacterium]|nr:GNAT family N-acetyltransferase [Candidatus Omnitrophota bacterium]
LTQTLDELQRDFKDQVFLKSLMHDKIIGSVRAFVQDRTCYASRLIVHPSYRNYGLGKKLMQRIESRFPQAARFEVFTGHKSKRNISFYQKLGYKVFKQEKVSQLRDRVFLEKFVCGERI